MKIKIMAISLSLALGVLAGCESTANNNANLRGANTNTGYVVNTSNTTNAGSMSSPGMNSGSSVNGMNQSNSMMMNSNNQNRP
jgi:hypothetical protein